MQRLLQRERVTEKGQMVLTQRDRGYRSRSSLPALMLEQVMKSMEPQSQRFPRGGPGCFEERQAFGHSQLLVNLMIRCHHREDQPV